MKIHSDKNGAHIRLTRVEKDHLRGLPKGLTPRTGPRRMALAQMVASHCPSAEQRAQEVVAWFDRTMEADHWFALSSVFPADAAMLLCRFNPHERKSADAEQRETDETGPRELVQLRERFVDLSHADSRARTLRDWLRIARELELHHHSWAQQYVDAVAMLKLERSRSAGYGFPNAERAAVPEPTAGDARPIEHWKMRIHAEAAAEWKRLRALNCNRTRASIRPHLVRWCREKNVKTDGNINPSDGYLRTHVLGGKHWTPPKD